MIPWNAEDLTFDESLFRGIARLFPLPGMVLFPHVMQPLHIFEPRYLDLLNEALDSDGLIAMSLPLSGSEQSMEGRPELRSTACLGRIVTHQRTQEGRYNLMLLGMRRVRIVQELSTTKRYRQAQVKLLDDVYPERGDARRERLQVKLCDLFQQFLPDQFATDETVSQLLTSEASLGAVTDLVSFAAPLPHELKYELLAQVDVDRRAEMLCQALADRVQEEPPRITPAGFPPPFSSN
jgi:Lon protease-like protein